MENKKVFCVTFSRGSGLCRDEVGYLVFDSSRENVERRVGEYFMKHFSKGNWHASIEEVVEDADDDGFCYLSGYYS